LAYWGISLYAGDLARGQDQFLLKYLLSSQSAILWMCALFAFATVAYWVGLLARGATALWMGTVLTWAASVFGLVGLLVRWHETHLISPDVGYIPVSNLYEVFILFALITSLFYLYYERRYQTRSLGGFVSLVIVAAVGFLLWYMATRSAHEIQPLVPALQSWWMKIHVPANFVGYGTFSIAAMVAFAYLVKVNAETKSWRSLIPLFLLGVLLCAEPLVFRRAGLPDYWALYFGVAAVFVGGVLAMRKRIGEVLPSLEVLDDIQYRAIAIGFAFFTVATILGALWAAEAWGTYWQWDPKETWALIVWLNYAAWLHLRLMKGLRGQFAAYWSLVGLLITGFAFLGVNMFLSGLHSYGQL
jgi:cytochrome c-type biogenesis protein CcsB